MNIITHLNGYLQVDLILMILVLLFLIVGEKSFMKVEIQMIIGMVHIIIVLAQQVLILTDFNLKIKKQMADINLPEA